MPHWFAIALCVAAAVPVAGRAPCFGAPQQVVDRIVATVEGDVITLSEVRELGAFNQLTGGAQGSDEELLQRLINQWIVTSEAAGSRFTGPSTERVEGEYTRLVAEFASPEAYRTRLRELALDEGAVRRQLGRQLFLTLYLDHKYRFLARVEDAAIEAYYRETLIPQLAARGQAVPRLDAVREEIREVLIQEEITRLAERWLEESRARLRIQLRGRGRRP